MADAGVIQEFLVAIGFKFDEAGAQRAASGVKGAEKSTNDLAAAVNKAAKALAELGQAMQKTAGDPASKLLDSQRKVAGQTDTMTKGFVAFGKVLVGTTAAFIAGMREVGKKYEELYYISQRTGASVQGLEALASGFQSIGRAGGEAASTIERMQSMFRAQPGRHEQFMSFANKYLPEIRNSIKGVDQATAEYFATVKGLRDMPAYLQQTFGAMMGWSETETQQHIKNIDAEIAATNRRKQVLEEAGLSAAKMQELSKDAAENQRLWNQLVADFGTIWTQAFGEIVKPLNWILRRLDEGVRWILRFNAALEELGIPAAAIESFAALGGAITAAAMALRLITGINLLGWIGPVAGVVGATARAFGGLALALTRFGTSALFAMGPWGILIGVLVSAISHWRDLKKAMEDAADMAGKAFNRLAENLGLKEISPASQAQRDREAAEVEKRRMPGVGGFWGEQQHAPGFVPGGAWAPQKPGAGEDRNPFTGEKLPPKMQQGGIVTSTGTAVVHAGETVLPAEVSKGLKDLGEAGEPLVNWLSGISNVPKVLVANVQDFGRELVGAKDKAAGGTPWGGPGGGGGGGAGGGMGGAAGGTAGAAGGPGGPAGGGGGGPAGAGAAAAGGGGAGAPSAGGRAGRALGTALGTADAQARETEENAGLERRSGGGDAHGGEHGAPPTGGGTSTSLGADRQRFAEELKNNPALREKVMRIAANEQGKSGRGTQQVIESMMNRASIRGRTLEQEAKWTGEKGYYAQGTMGKGALEDPAHKAILENSLNQALGGGNLANYATDNASQGLAVKDEQTGAFKVASHSIEGGQTGQRGNETFFTPGSANPGDQKRFAEWRGRMGRGEAGPAGGGSAMDPQHKGGGVDPDLLKAMNASWNEVLPKGYTARLTSGARPGGSPSSQHHHGHATDWQIYDEKGNPIANRGEDTSGLYSKASVHALAHLMENSPEKAKQFIHGRHFGTALGGGGEADLMHYDIGGRRGRKGDINEDWGKAAELVQQRRDEARQAKAQAKSQPADTPSAELKGDASRVTSSLGPAGTYKLNSKGEAYSPELETMSARDKANIEEAYKSIRERSAKGEVPKVPAVNYQAVAKPSAAQIGEGEAGAMPSAQRGGIIPNLMGGMMPLLVHSGEMVLPKLLSQGLQRMIGGGGLGGILGGLDRMGGMRLGGGVTNNTGGSTSLSVNQTNHNNFAGGSPQQMMGALHNAHQRMTGDIVRNFRTAMG